MLMNHLLQTSLFSLLTKPSLVSVDKMKNAYEDFIKDITHQQPEITYEQVFRRLTIARVELVSLQTLLQNEEGKKHAQNSVLYKRNCPTKL